MNTENKTKRYEVVQLVSSPGAPNQQIPYRSFATEQAAQRFADRKNAEPMEKTGGGFFTVIDRGETI